MAKRTRTTKTASTLTAKENAMLTFIKEWEERQKEKEAPSVPSVPSLTKRRVSHAAHRTRNVCRQGS